MQFPDVAKLKGAIERLLANTASTEDRDQVQAALAAGVLSMATGERTVAIGGDANGAIFVMGDGNTVLHVDASKVAALDQRLKKSHLSLREAAQADLDGFKKALGLASGVVRVIRG